MQMFSSALLSDWLRELFSGHPQCPGSLFQDGAREGSFGSTTATHGYRYQQETKEENQEEEPWFLC